MAATASERVVAAARRLEGGLRRRIPDRAKPLLLDAIGAFDPLAVRAYRLRTGDTGPIPPFQLRQRVGPGWIPKFVASGQLTARGLLDAAAAAGLDLRESEVLDFGCGAGRTIRPLLERGVTRLTGCDVNETAIAWLQQNLGDRALFVANGFQPPLPFDDASFDVVYSISILTHLDQPTQAAWLPDIARVLRAGGLALLTTHGEYAYNRLRGGEVAGTSDLLRRIASHGELAREGFVFEDYDSGNALPGVTGAYGLTFQTFEHARETWPRELELIDFRPRGMEDWQDVIVARRSETAGR